MLGNNMFAYCNNGPINHYDPLGATTFGLSLGGNITIGIGMSISIGVFWDTEGNFEFQWSYVVPGVDDTAMAGLIDAGVGATFQITDRDTIYDLYGPATSIGGSVGPGWYVGGDIISFSDASDTNNEINGIQVTGGVGIGLDFHVAESYTRPVFTQKASTNSGKTKRSIHPNHKSILQRRLTY